jgi:hypothetical protein
MAVCGRGRVVCLMKNINLFIVGAAKAGTTSLWSAFRSHPDVFVTEDELYKEPAFFSSYGERMGFERYHSLYSGYVDQKYICDASTAYLTSPESAERIYRYNRHAKIIIVLRDPIARAYSLYNWMVADGYEWAGSFEYALRLEEKRFKNGSTNYLMPEYFWNYMYFRSGCYLNQVERYQKYFGDNVLIVSFGELVASPSLLFSRVCEFLNVRSIPIQMPRENASVDVYNPALTFLSRKVTTSFYARFFQNSIKTKSERDALVSMTRRSVKPQPIEAATRNDLLNRYESELALVEKRFGIRLINQ